jgi:hypothetical protein
MRPVKSPNAGKQDQKIPDFSLCVFLLVGLLAADLRLQQLKKDGERLVTFIREHGHQGAQRGG